MRFNTHAPKQLSSVAVLERTVPKTEPHWTLHWQSPEGEQSSEGWQCTCTGTLLSGNRWAQAKVRDYTPRKTLHTFTFCMFYILKKIQPFHNTEPILWCMACFFIHSFGILRVLQLCKLDLRVQVSMWRAS